MFCSNCGQEVGNAQFCSNCGSRVSASQGTIIIRKATLNTLVGIGTDIYVDGRFNSTFENVNKITLTLPAGSHEIRLQLKDYADAVANISIVPNSTVNYVLEVDENNKMTQLAKWEDVRVAPAAATAPIQPAPFVNRTPRRKRGITCPRCGNDNVTVQVVQENLGGTSITKTKGTTKEQGHGLLWWLLIGWWWKIIDLFIWFFYFFPRLIISLVFPRKKKYKSESVSVTKTSNKIVYRKICTCQSCGNSWRI